MSKNETTETTPVAELEASDLNNLVSLLPCPFCGSDADIREDVRGMDDLDDVWVIGCTTCPAEMDGERNSNPNKHFHDEKEITIELWNTRAR